MLPCMWLKRLSLMLLVCSHSFTECATGLLQKVPGGTRLRQPHSPLLHQTKVKSVNRLLWPNLLKPRPGSGQFTACQIGLSHVSWRIHRAAAQLRLKAISLLSGLDWQSLVRYPYCEKPRSSLQLVAQRKLRAEMVLFIHSVCVAPPTSPHVTAAITANLCSCWLWSTRRQARSGWGVLTFVYIIKITIKRNLCSRSHWTIICLTAKYKTTSQWLFRPARGEYIYLSTFLMSNSEALVLVYFLFCIFRTLLVR